jgi:hypothetical protein
VALTRQLLAFSRMQVLQPRVLDLNSVASEIGKMLPRLIGEDVEYVFRPGASLGRRHGGPRADRAGGHESGRLRDAMPEGGSLTVTTRNVAITEAKLPRARRWPPDRMRFSAADTGHGMDEATKAHIFEPFFTTKEVGKGTVWFGHGVRRRETERWVYLGREPKGKGATFDIYRHRRSRRLQRWKRRFNPRRSVVAPRRLVVEDEESVRSWSANS